MDSESILDTPVATIVARSPGTGRVFERFGIEYCCQGRRRLGEACAERGVSPGEVLKALRSASGPATGEPDVLGMTMIELADHIERTHHARLKTELPRLCEMAAKVERAHGDHHEELADLQRTVDTFAEEMFEHMAAEERVLFPAIRTIERDGGGPAPLVSDAIRCMMSEHEDAGEALERMRSLTGGFVPPADACPTFRALLHDLNELESDTHRHVHKENNFLFPGAARALGITIPGMDDHAASSA